MLSLIIAYTLNNSIFCSAVFAVTFRKLILKVWKSTVSLLCEAWSALISLAYLCVASFIVLSLAAGSQGGYFISEYVAEHINPAVCFAIMAFAQLFLQVTNLYSPDRVCVDKAEYLHASDIAVRFKSFFSTFDSPTPVLLQ